MSISYEDLISWQLLEAVVSSWSFRWQYDHWYWQGVSEREGRIGVEERTRGTYKWEEYSFYTYTSFICALLILLLLLLEWTSLNQRGCYYIIYCFCYIFIIANWNDLIVDST